jgi:predicted transcriptional regulator
MRQTLAVNSRKKRSHLELIAEILDTARIGRTKTTIMCKAGMSYRQFKHYLEFLNQAGLLESNEGVYQTTAKGVAFVKEYKTLVMVLLTEDSELGLRASELCHPRMFKKIFLIVQWLNELPAVI